MTDVLAAPNPVLDRLAAASRLTFTKRDGRSTAWRQWGSGKPLLMLHGGTGSWRHWVRNIEFFARERMVVCPDSPGMGLSDDPLDPPQIDEIGLSMTAGLDELIGAGTHYDMMAFSYGGFVSSQFILRHRGRQDAIVYASPGSLAKTQIPPLQKVRSQSGDSLVEAHRFNLGSLMIHDPDKVDDLAVRVQHENTLEARLRGQRTAGVGLRVHLGLFRGKLAVLWGTCDKFLYEGALDERRAVLARHRPDAEIVMVPGAGHWLAYEAADFFNGFARGFMAGAPTVIAAD